MQPARSLGDAGSSGHWGGSLNLQQLVLLEMETEVISSWSHVKQEAGPG